MPNAQLIYAETPKGEPIPGQTLKRVVDNDFDATTVELNGGVVIKNKAISLDPYMRGRMRDPSIKSYSPPYEVNKPLTAFAVGEIVKSEHENYKTGQTVYGMLDVAEFTILPAAAIQRIFRIVDNKENLPATTLVGAAGMSGQTAFWSFYEIGKPKKGETIVVSAAAGAVGQIVTQLAKREGLRVVGLVGSDEKAKYVKEELGADIVINYKTQNLWEEFKALDGIDIYFDNVGGETLDAALANMATFGRIIACGAISQYNGAQYKLSQYMSVVTKQLIYQGFIISSKDLTRFWKEMPAMIAAGDIKVKESVYNGIDSGEAFVDLLTGRAHGKVVISVE